VSPARGHGNRGAAAHRANNPTLSNVTVPAVGDIGRRERIRGKNDPSILIYVPQAVGLFLRQESRKSDALLRAHYSVERTAVNISFEQ
jgi:hypothetical protein